MLYKIFKVVSTLLIAASIIMLVLIFWPVAKEQVKYSINQASGVRYVVGYEQFATFEKPISPVNLDFSIIIPKLAAAAPIIDNVDPANETEYLKALKKGIAHAKGTAYPGERGNVYLFAHSTDSFYNVGKYNAVFFLLGKLKPGDQIFIFYRNIKIEYIVEEIKVVAPNDSQYLSGVSEEKILTLQTCYPPGTTYQRLIVIAKQVDG